MTNAAQSGDRHRSTTLCRRNLQQLREWNRIAMAAMAAIRIPPDHMARVFHGAVRLALIRFGDRDLPGGIRNAFGVSKINKLRKSLNLDFDAPAVVSRESDAIGLKQYRYWQHPPADPAQREKQCV
ncbi:hypothetical protein [Nitrobacter sp. 62-13]|uniref:hypothetical protein n=1 Tax=Nitrobacter sp. 62-13 TaxID=1895797 RepID=UPI0025D65846|nr:hypothetical protein [Nitrobacter sp. 62-13]